MRQPGKCAYFYLRRPLYTIVEINLIGIFYDIFFSKFGIINLFRKDLLNNLVFMISYFDANVKAGFPSPAMDYLEERIDLTKLYVQHPAASFIVKCSGDSMLYAIPEEAELLVDRSITPQTGDIVVAAREGEFTVKFLKKESNKGWLVPANRKYPSFPINEDVIIWGKVIRIFVNPENVRACMP